MIGAADALRLEWETRLPASVLGLDDLEVTGPGKDFDGPVAATSTAASGWTRPAAGPPARRCCGACARANPCPGSAPWISSLVDVADVVWLRFQVLVGLYDLVRGRGRLRLRPDLRGRRPRPLRQPLSRPGTVIATDTRRAAWIFFLPVSEPALALTCEPVPGYGCGGVRRP